MPRIAPPDTLLQATRFDVVRVDFPQRGGGVRPREVIVPNNAVVILPILQDTPGRETVVLIRNRRPAVGEALWELPAGTLEPDEAPQRCAARELTEETGYEAQRLERLCAFYSAPGFCTELLTAYVAHGLRHVGQALDETEQIEVEVKTLDEALQMTRDNRIRDAKTMTALLYYQAFCRETR